MSTSLTDLEKQQIIEIYEILFSSDPYLRIHKSQINQLTIGALENAFLELEKCNTNVSDLLIQLLGVGTKAKKGWLRWLLKSVCGALKANKDKYNWVMCKNITTWQTKRYIQATLW